MKICQYVTIVINENANDITGCSGRTSCTTNEMIENNVDAIIAGSLSLFNVCLFFIIDITHVMVHNA